MRVELEAEQHSYYALAGEAADVVTTLRNAGGQVFGAVLNRVAREANAYYNAYEESADIQLSPINS
jgi:hypothetical protein